MGFPMDEAFVDGRTEIYMKETIQTAFNKAQVSLLAQHKAGNIKVNGSKAKWPVKGFANGQMEPSTKVFG